MTSKISFQALNRTKLVDDIVIQLQKKISSGDIEAGDKIPTEPELMEQFGVGRSTIREAVRVLVHAGLLEKKQGYGTFVTAAPVIQEPLDHRLRRAEVVEVFEVRKMLELEIAKLAARRRDSEDIAMMREHLDSREHAIQLGQIELYLNHDIAFHLCVAAASKNHVIVDLYRTFSSVLRETLDRLAKNKEVHNPHTAYHEKLYEAIVAQDEAAAVHWTRQFLEKTVEQLEVYLQQRD